MRSHGSFEDALVDFAAVIIPLGQELGGPSPTLAAASLAFPLKSFFGLFLLNVLSFILLRLFMKLAVHVLRSFISDATSAFRSLHIWCHRLVKRRIMRAAAHHRRRHRAKRSRFGEGSQKFESWEEFSRRFKMWESSGKHTANIEDALRVLGLTPFASEREIRGAYLRLTKTYHPDHAMHAPQTERERLQNYTIKIRQAYETLTNRPCQVR